MEGYYWRFAHRMEGWAVAAICGLCRAPEGTWAMVTLAAEPGGLERTEIAPSARADPAGIGVEAGGLLRAGPDHLEVDLGPGARLRAELRDGRGWPRRAWGALGPAHALPGLGQYWSPHLLGGRVTGDVELSGRSLQLAGADAYAEKNWGAAFAAHWWWGQGHVEDGAGVAFAGGRLRRGPLAIAPTAVAVWAPGALISLAPPLARTAAGAGGGAWRISARSARWRVALEGEAPGAPLRLPVPVPAERRVDFRADHHLVGRLALTVHRGRRLWLRGEAPVAALEDGRPTPR
jgi:tocopherol cyclase